jgi:beta-N-acetylhexosaminidase
MATPSTEALRRQVGQLMIMGFDGTGLDDRLQTMFTTLQPGGVILFRRNIETAAQTHALLRGVQKVLGRPLYRSVDMEGGTVDRFRHVLARVPSAQDVARTSSTALYRKHGELIGRQLRALGFNTDFAPCLDLGLEPSRKALGSRTVSADPNEVVQYARAFLHGLGKQRVLGCGKHFPGLGGGKLDSHEALPVIDRSWKQLWEQDLLAYRELRRELPFVMVAHVEYPKIVRGHGPASLSKRWIEGVLREKVGYHGLVVSDDLDMGGVQNGASIEDAAVGTLEAGSDLFLICQNEEHVWRAHEAVLKQAEHSRGFAHLLSRKGRRVRAGQVKLADFGWKLPPPPTADCVSLFRRRISEFTEAVDRTTRAASRERAE